MKYWPYDFHGGKIDKEGTVIDLLFDIPYLIGFGRPFPSFHEMNSMLKNGFLDAGMSGGCEWEPFEINREEYQDIFEKIKNDKRLTDRPIPLI